MKTLAATHDLEHLDAFLWHIPQERRSQAVDGGAHRGIWTRRLAHEFDRVLALEPVMDLYADLPYLGNVRTVNAALGATEGVCGIALGPDNDGQGHVTNGTDVTMRPLDAYGLKSLDFLKLDVEGYELHALTGADETIGRCRPWVMIEQNGLCERYGIPVGAAARWLERQGYTLCEVQNKDHLYAP